MSGNAQELAAKFRSVNGLLRNPGVTVDDASDEGAYRFEVPGVVLDQQRHLLPRTDPRVQALFSSRRVLAHQAFDLVQPEPA